MSQKDGPIKPSEMFTRAGHLSTTGAVVAMDAESSEELPRKLVNHLISCKKCQDKIQNMHATLDLVRRAFWWSQANRN